MPKWQFEHFKTFISYDIMQPAASCLLIFEGESTDNTPKMKRLTKMLIERTGHPSWTTKRDTGNLDVDREGSVFRNKARLFSSLYIIVPPELLRLNGIEKVLKLTDFGRYLGLGYVSEKDYYNFIIKTFRYPHPAYFNDYSEWTKNEANIRPFVLILKVLIALLEKFDLEEAFITSKEIAYFLEPLNNEENIEEVSEAIRDLRSSEGEVGEVETRKIDEILSFLSKSGYVYIHTEKTEEKYHLNLIGQHELEKSYYIMERKAGGPGTKQRKFANNKIEEIRNIWEE